jgi:hypothetical protein
MDTKLKPENMNYKNILDEYVKLISNEDLCEIEQESLRCLKARQDWHLRDAAHAWTSAVLYILLRKGMLRSVQALEQELKLK